jgi:uncharacterized CHY-type Zn-finger protein
VNISGRELEFNLDLQTFRYGYSTIFFRIFGKRFNFTEIEKIDLNCSDWSSNSWGDPGENYWSYSVEIVLNNNKRVVFYTSLVDINKSRQFTSKEYYQALSCKNELERIIFHAIEKNLEQTIQKMNIIDFFNKNQNKRRKELWFYMISFILWFILNRILFSQFF